MEDLGLQLRSFFGLFASIAICWLLGPRKAIPVKLIAGALLLQFLIAIILYSFAPTRAFLGSLTGVVQALQAATMEGADFVFGYLSGSTAPFVVDEANAGRAFIFAFQALPMVIVLSALSALLWRWRILEFVVRGFAFAFRKTLGLSGAASLGA